MGWAPGSGFAPKLWARGRTEGRAQNLSETFTAGPHIRRRSRSVDLKSPGEPRRWSHITPASRGVELTSPGEPRRLNHLGKATLQNLRDAEVARRRVGGFGEGG